MSSPTRVGSVHFPPLVVYDGHDGLRWQAAYGPGGRIRPSATGYVAESPSFIPTERTTACPTPEAAAAAALVREATLAPLVQAVSHAYPGAAAVLLFDGNYPDVTWPWPLDTGVRPVNLACWERRAARAAAAYRRYSLVLKDLTEERAWVVETTAAGVGIVRLPAAGETATTRWLVRGGQKRRLVETVERREAR